MRERRDDAIDLRIKTRESVKISLRGELREIDRIL
jgi:hypothetical protein